MIYKIILYIQKLILNVSFMAGFLLSVILFAYYIFSPHNLYEDFKRDLLAFQKGENGNLNNSYNNIYHHRYYYK